MTVFAPLWKLQRLLRLSGEKLPGAQGLSVRLKPDAPANA
jgi:hypothetical protein